MKNSVLNLIFGVFFFATLMFLNSCTKDQEIITSADQPQLPKIEEPTPGIASSITVQNGLLNFQTLEDFRNTVLALNQMNPQDQLSWEKSLDFNSMQQIFNDIMLAEFETSGSHSALYNEQLQNGLIVENNTDGLYNLNLFNPAYATVLNENGMVIVDNSIYQFTGNALKIWENGDVNQLQTLANTTASTANINIVPMNFQEATLRSAPHWTDECESGDNTGLIRITALYNSEFLEGGNPDIAFIEYFVNVQSMIMTPGNELEFDPNATVRLMGRSELLFTLTNGTMERSMNQMRTYNQIIGFGGNFTFIPLEAGQYNFPDPWVFVNPIHLVRTQWQAQNKLSDGTSYTCGITF